MAARQNCGTMSATRTLLPLLMLAVQVAGQDLLSGECRQLPAVNDFQRIPFLGLWFDFAKNEERGQQGQKCIYSLISDAGDGKILIVNKGILISNGTKVTDSGLATPHGSETTASWNVTLVGTGHTGNYTLVYTDYVGVAIFWDCYTVRIEGQVVSFQVISIITRDRSPSQELRDNTTMWLQQNHLNTSGLIFTDQENCPPAEDGSEEASSTLVTTHNPTPPSDSSEEASDSSEEASSTLVTTHNATPPSNSSEEDSDSSEED